VQSSCSEYPHGWGSLAVTSRQPFKAERGGDALALYVCVQPEALGMIGRGGIHGNLGAAI